MIVFSSLKAARTAGFRWYDFNGAENMHIVETDHPLPGGRRVKALALARPTPEDAGEGL